MSDQDNRAFRLGAGEGRRIWAFGDLMILKLTAAQTSGRVFVMEQHVPRHRRAPGRHVHEVDDQSWFVIAGRGRWFIGDATIDAGGGHNPFTGTLQGGGDDVLKGGPGDDGLFGDHWADTGGVTSGSGDDTCQGGQGTDTAASCEDTTGVP